MVSENATRTLQTKTEKPSGNNSRGEKNVHCMGDQKEGKSRKQKRAGVKQRTNPNSQATKKKKKPHNAIFGPWTGVKDVRPGEGGGKER